MAAVLWIGNPPFCKLRKRHILTEATFHYIPGIVQIVRFIV
jgi:hypothetical protein